MQTLRSFACTLAALGSAIIASGLATGCVADSGPDATITVFNDSDFTIVELNLVPNFASTWGSDLLRGNDLLPDEQITLAVDCGTYDARLIDEDDVECKLFDLDLCLNDADWVIHNNTCTVFGAARAAREAAKKAAAEAATPSATTAPSTTTL
jgi:hypothetical protein